jgi:hypothetical protein
MMGPQPQAELQSDGTFTFNSVMPGQWRLNVNGAPGYIKSVRQGDQDVTPWDLAIGTSPVELKVVIGTKFAQVEASLAAAASGGEQTAALLWPINGDPQFQQNLPINPQGHNIIMVPPGKYHACAFAAAQSWILMQNRALRKALESHCETVEASEGEKASVQVTVITAADLKQMLEKIEE